MKKDERFGEYVDLYNQYDNFMYNITFYSNKIVSHEKIYKRNSHFTKSNNKNRY